MFNAFRRLHFRHQIMALMLFIVATAILLSVAIALPYMREANRRLTFDRLQSIAVTKAGWAGEMLDRMSNETLATARSEYTIEIFKEFSGVFEEIRSREDSEQVLQALRTAYTDQPTSPTRFGMTRSDWPDYDRLHQRAQMFRLRRWGYDYADTLFVDAETGLVLYSVAKNPDFLTSLEDGPYAQYNEGEVFDRVVRRRTRARGGRPPISASTAPSRGPRAALDGGSPGDAEPSRRGLRESEILGRRRRPARGTPLGLSARAASAAEIVFTDFSPMPDGDTGPTACIGAPVYDEEMTLLGVLINRVSVEPFNRIMLEPEGLGETGETYLVGPDNLMRSNSPWFEDPTILSQPVDTPYVNAALGGEHSSGIVQSYRGQEVFAVWMPIDVYGQTWALVAEQAAGEVYGALNAIMTRMVWLWGFVALGLIALSYVFARQIDRPVKSLVKRSRMLADSHWVEPAGGPASSREIDELVGAFDEMALRIREREEMKDEFLYIASHDLKNPLTAILGASGVIQEILPPGAPQTDKTYDLIRRVRVRALEMQRIIEDFLDFQAMEDGQFKIIRQPFDLKHLMAEVIEKNEDYARGKKIHLAYEDGPDLPRVLGDPARIEQVAANLVGNAIKFCPPGGSVSARARLEAGASPASESVVFEVSDTGPGLDEEDMAKLFTKYARLKNRPTGGEKSSGLGLAICRRLIELHHGRIGARNNPTGGATFWFRLPRHTGPDDCGE